MTDNPQGSQGYPGQLGLTDDNSDFNKIAFVVQQILGAHRTMTLVKVTAVTNSGGIEAVGFVDVQPLVNQIDGVGNATAHGEVFNLPYFRLQGGKNAIILDPEVGDVGIAIIADRDVSAVKSTKKQANPGSFRRGSLSDGVYVGGILNGTPEQWIAFSSSGVTLTDKTGNVLSTSSSGIAITPKAGLPVTVNGNLVVTQNLQLQGSIQSQAGGTYSGDLKTGGNVIAGVGTGDQVGLQTHTHTQPNDSHGDTEQPTAAPTAGT